MFMNSFWFFRIILCAQAVVFENIVTLDTKDHVLVAEPGMSTKCASQTFLVGNGEHPSGASQVSGVSLPLLNTILSASGTSVQLFVVSLSVTLSQIP